MRNERTVVTVPGLELKRSGDRFLTRTPWLESHHSFSFGRHRDPSNVRHGLLLVSNDDIIKAGSGFETHPHRDMEIVTWVLEGELEHKDSEGNSGIIYPGLAQRMSAGTGIWHSEMNPSGSADVHLVQMWVLPDTQHAAPGYEQRDVSAALARGGLVPIASGRNDDSVISIRQRGATLWAARLRPNESVQVPDAPFVHLFVARGAAGLEGAGSLEAGDAVRLARAGQLRLTADVSRGCEILIWETT